MPSTAPIGIELRHLRYFLAVSEELHFGRAAERLHIAQPPLSQAIRKLEDELGTVLFRRTSRQVIPTEAGRVFAEEAQKVLAGFELAVAEARRAAGVGAVLRIGCVPHLPIERLLRFLSMLRERDPSSSPTDVTHLFALEQVSELRSGALDVGVFDHVKEHAGIDTVPLFPGEHLAAFLPPRHELAARASLAPEDLRGQTLVIFRRDLNPALHDCLVARLEHAGYRFAGLREATGKAARDIMFAVAEGHGVAFAPHSFKELTEGGTTVIRRDLACAVSMPDTVVAWRANPPRQLGTILGVAREVAKTLYADGAAEKRD